MRLIIYPHVLASRDEVVEWLKGTLMTEYEKRLTPEQFAGFLAAYRARLLPQLEDAGASSILLVPVERMIS